MQGGRGRGRGEYLRTGARFRGSVSVVAGDATIRPLRPKLAFGVRYCVTVVCGGDIGIRVVQASMFVRAAMFRVGVLC